MSKTYLFSLGAIALYLFVVKPVNKKIDVESSETITNDLLIGGFDKASHTTTSNNTPVHTL